MNDRQCSVTGCDGKPYSQGYCSGHYQRVRKGLDISPPIIKRERHGKSNSCIYNTWSCMIHRCCNSRSSQWVHYGGRGILVCEEWRQSFSKFYKDMGDPPKGRSLDRIDNNLGYSKDNCRWATQEQQVRNTRIHRTNKTGLHGVLWDSSRNRWRTYITLGDIYHHLGRYHDFFEACCARKSAENRVRFR